MDLVLHLWEARVAGRLPSDLEDAERQRSRLAGTQADSRAAFQRFGRAVNAALAQAGLAATPPFADDPSDWGADLGTPCPAVWELSVAADRATQVLPLLASKAVAMGLVLLDPAHSIVHRPKEMPPQFKSTVRVEDDRIVGVLQLVLTRAQEFEKACAGALAARLGAHGFRNAQANEFERTFPGGKLILAIGATELDERSVGVQVDVCVRFDATKELLAKVPGAQGSYLPGAPTIHSPLQLLASGSEATARLFVGREVGRHTIIASTTAQAVERTTAEVVPMLAVVLDDAQPWFQDPKTVIEMHLQFFLEQSQAPAGFEFVCMEDLILAQAFKPGLLKQLHQKRRQMELDFARMVPPPSRWSTAEGLDRVYAFAAKEIPPNAGLRGPAPASAGGTGGSSMPAAKGSALMLVIAALLLNGVWLALATTASGSKLWASLQGPAYWLALLLSAVAIYQAARSAFGPAWVKFVLALTILVAPIHALVLAYLAWRLASPRPA